MLYKYTKQFKIGIKLNHISRFSITDMRKTFVIFYIKRFPITIRKVMALDVGRFKYIAAIYFNLRRLKRVSLVK